MQITFKANPDLMRVGDVGECVVGANDSLRRQFSIVILGALRARKIPIRSPNGIKIPPESLDITEKQTRDFVERHFLEKLGDFEGELQRARETASAQPWIQQHYDLEGKFQSYATEHAKYKQHIEPEIESEVSRLLDVWYRDGSVLVSEAAEWFCKEHDFECTIVGSSIAGCTTLRSLNELARERGEESLRSRVGWNDEREGVGPKGSPCIALLVNGREAIPVRAIPFVTGWDVSPDELVLSLANTPGGVRLDRLTAYQYHADGNHTPILPKEWGGIVDRLKGLSASLEAKNSNREITRPEWLNKSIPILPAGVFVWKADLEKSFSRWSWETGTLEGDRPNDGKLNFSPLIPEAWLREKVSEGFAFHQAAAERAQQAPPPINDRQTMLRLRKSVTIEEAAEMLTGINGWTKENRAAIDLVRESIQNGELEPESVHYFDEDAWTFDASRAVIDHHATTVTAANFDAWRARTFPSTESAQATDTAPQMPDEAQEQAALSGTTEKAAPEVAPDEDDQGDDLTPAERRVNHDMATERGYRRAILDNWEEIEKLCGPKADGSHVLRVLNRHKAKDKELCLKTIQNRLIDLRREKLIPG